MISDEKRSAAIAAVRLIMLGRRPESTSLVEIVDAVREVFVPPVVSAERLNDLVTIATMDISCQELYEYLESKGVTVVYD